MKKPNVIRPIKLTMNLPEDVRTKLDLFLFSDVEGRVPQGAYQRFFVERINEFFASIKDPQPRFQPDQKVIVGVVLKAAIENFTQEWWTENFSDPQTAYIFASELSRALLK